VKNWLTKAVGALNSYWSIGPANLADPALSEWVNGGGAQSHAGKPVTVDSALQIATAWACIRLNGQTVGTLSLEPKRWDGRAMVPARDHPLWDVLHSAPNSDMSAAEFWTAMCVNLLAWGNAFAEIHRTSQRLGARVVALTPLPPQYMAVSRADDGSLRYRLQDPAAGPRDLPENDVLHVKYLTLDGINGLSPIGYARHTLGLAIAADETAGKLFAQGMRTGGFLTVPTFLNDHQRKLMKARMEDYRGSINAGKTPLLEGAMDYKALTMPPQEAELLATREFAVEEICRVYGTPPWLVGHTAKSTSWGSGLEQQMLGWYQLSLRPLLKNFEGAIQRRLFAPGERARMQAEFNVESLLRADSKGRSEFLRTMVQAGVMTINEARAKEGLPPIEGGDQALMQSNMLPLSALGQATSRDQIAGARAPQEATNDDA
jgi:HK97 family phage portal protein